MGDTADDGDYDIEQAWRQLRKDHAMRCQAFLRAHSEALVQKYTALLQPSNLENETRSAVATFYSSREGSHYSDTEKSFFTQKVLDFVWLTRRQLLSNSGHAKKAMEEAEEKRTKAFQEAHALYNAADLRTLIALGKLNVNDRRSYKEGSLMDYLCNHTPTDDVLEKILKGIKDKKIPAPSAQKRTASSGKKRSATPRKTQGSSSSRRRTPSRPRTPGRAGSSSKRAASAGQPARSSSQRSRKLQSPPPQRPSRGRSASRGRANSRSKLDNKQRTLSAKRTGSRQRSTSQKKVSFGKTTRWSRHKKRQG
eukprot:TRINITY_DN20129_c0_g2_i2.p1 TRINITY_DN20129_c0_g2~~TRINITY_DN20129_c0_g2_i2.p1  ORF type:complete len:322 (-),score=44.27 TRINITY_DN20129_c0_g2_i2:400-1326(-)